MSYGYRSVVDPEVRPFGRVSRYNQDVPALGVITPNVSGLDVDFDLAGEDFGESGQVTQTVDWGDTNVDEQESADSTAFAHTYGGAGTYDIVITIKDVYGFADQVTAQVVVAP